MVLLLATRDVGFYSPYCSCPFFAPFHLFSLSPQSEPTSSFNILSKKQPSKPGDMRALLRPSTHQNKPHRSPRIAVTRPVSRASRVRV